MARKTLRGKTALVTGAARRIGRAIALALADEGVNVAVHYRNSREEAKNLCAEIRRRGVGSWSVSADFERPDEYEGFMEKVWKIAGPVDMLVNNSSIFSPSSLLNMDFAGVARNMEVNAWVPLALSRDFARLAGKGKIVNIIDSRVWGNDRAHAAYILSKHMLWVLTKMCAVEFAPDITVNAVAPGLILPSEGMDRAVFERMAETLPLRRHGDPEDIADAVVYLLGSGFLTGEVIHVDGGLHLTEYKNGSHSDS
jgi:pteridine reductase